MHYNWFLPVFNVLENQGMMSRITGGSVFAMGGFWRPEPSRKDSKIRCFRMIPPKVAIYLRLVKHGET